MPANTAAIFSLAPDVQWGATTVATANTAKDGTGTVLTAFTSDATNGGFVSRLRIRPAGTNIATVLRVFINNGSSNAVAANNILFDEVTCPSTALSEVAALAPIEVPLNFALPAGYNINITIGTTIAAGLYCSVIGGKY